MRCGMVRGRWMAPGVAWALVAGLAAWPAAGCRTLRVDEEPILENGDRVAEPAGAVDAERHEAEADRARREERRDALAAEALATCEGEVCDALLGGELALGMNEVQVLSATGTTEGAWRVRRSGDATVMTPASLVDSPRDAVSAVALVHLRDGRVARYGYREAQGLRVVDAPEEATTEGRGRALAEMLIREGDELAAAGDFVRALDRYDRADLLSDDPIIAYKIGAALDKQLRPIEALIQYQLFLHRLELERIEARGNAAAKLADAIARAQQRIIILERQTGRR